MASRPRFDAVLFDFDGVLVRSMEQHAEAYRRILAPFGIENVNDREIFLLEGKKSAEVISLMLEARGRGDLLDRVPDLAEQKNAAYRAMGVPPLYPGARDVVEALKREGVPVGIATGTTTKNVHHILGDFVNSFDAVVTATDVRRTKPNPEPYLKAAAKLGVSPRRVVVVENAPFGVLAGVNAGAHVLALPTTLPRDHLWEAHRIIDSIGEVPGALAALNRSPGGAPQ
ncbi:MAG TPA: HAD family phosphatase [Candidatus Thermoplasmatota archaeon]|nr:HAD family phosphatase [Candidatus Thermoplasmatota archaeon]